MQGSWSKILVPLTLVGMALAGTGGNNFHGVPSAYMSVRSIDPDSLRINPGKDSIRTRPVYTIQHPAGEYIDWEDIEDIYEETEETDTVPLFTARDTMVVPDSLRDTDPFLYKWYVATKDSLVHRIVVDSLKNAGDTTDWVIIDSLYLKDSTDIAVKAFNEWYNSLDKAARKAYDYKQQLPILLHRQDSILHRKDSIRNRRDSIFENTPRILETAYLPDSLQYRRMLTWHHDRAFNRVELFDYDTTFNYRFHDYPFQREDVGATWLGMAGSAVMTHNFFKRGKVESVSFFAPYETWTENPESIPIFNTKTPYTELQYSGTLLSSTMKESNNLRLFTTQNIFPQLNIALEYRRYGGSGILQNEATDNRTSIVSGNWMGKRYLAHGGYIHNKVTRGENGGVRDIMWIRDTLVDAREISVNLSGASNTFKKNTFFFDQSYRLPLSFLLKLIKPGADSLETENLSSAFVGTSTEYTTYTKLYNDAISASNSVESAFFNDRFYINPTKSADSLSMTRFDNKVFLRIQPWSENAVLSKIEGGVGNRYLSHYMPGRNSYLTTPEKTVWNTFYTYAGAEGHLPGNISWNAFGQIDLIGAEAGDTYLGADAKMVLHPFRRDRKSPMTFSASISEELDTPDLFQQQFHSNHYSWNSSFDKVSTTKIQGSVDIPKWRFAASAGYALLANNIYYDTLGVARQNAEPMSVLSAAVRKDFVIGDFLHLDNSALIQYSSNEEVLPLPLLALNLRWYIQFNVVRKDVMQMQLGADTRYTTPWYLPSYNPVTGTFMAQNAYAYGNCPVFDLFMNIQWKKACLFVKWENAGRGWPMSKRDYFSAHRYISTDREIKVGIWWPFYVSSKQQKTMSARAGSGMSGGGGGFGGGLGGIKNLGR